MNRERGPSSAGHRSWANLISLVGFLGALASILSAFDYYVLRTGIAAAMVPLWAVALVVGAVSIVLVVGALRLRHEAGARPVSLLRSEDAAVLEYVTAHGLLANSRQLDVWLYTAETIVRPWHAALLAHQGSLAMRILMRRPENDQRKRKAGESSLSTVREIARLRPDFSLDIHFYSDPPLLRLQSFKSDDGRTCLVGIYRKDEEHPFRYIGAEENRMFVLEDARSDDKLVIDALLSRFDESWCKTSALRAVLFDFDGVLVDSMELHFHQWKEVFEKQGLRPDADVLRHDVYRLEGYKAALTIRELVQKYSGSAPTSDAVRRMCSHKMALYMGNIKAIRPFPGMHEVTAMLRERGVPLAVVSGGIKKSVEEIVARFFPGVFRAVVGDSDTEVGKPGPDPYRKALEMLDVEDKLSCLVVENSPLGVMSARAAGLPVVGILRNSPLQAEDIKQAGAIDIHASAEDLLDTLKEARFLTPSVMRQSGGHAARAKR